MKIWISGITGTLGTEITKQLLEKYVKHEIFGYSRDEFKQQKFPYKDKVTMILGDIRDKTRVLEATREMDMIFHFAALKHVDVLEKNPEESIATNVIGTQNILYAQRINKIKRVCLSSTDKAAYPINTYGLCKALSERLVLRNKNNVVVRYGNVLASRGSVIPTFVETLEKESTAYITDTAMSRFFIRIEDAAKFVIDSAFEVSGGLKIPPMKAAKMTTVAETINKLLGNNIFRISICGIRPGEKLAECLRTDYEGEMVTSDSCEQFSNYELESLLKPIVEDMIK